MSTDVGPPSVSARVSVVLVEETGVRRAGKLASVPVHVDEQMLIGVACSASVAECMDDVVLPMLAGTVSPSDVAELVAEDTASMADVGILFPADSAGTLSPSDPAEILLSAVPAGIPFPAGPTATTTTCVYLDRQIALPIWGATHVFFYLFYILFLFVIFVFLLVYS